MTPAHFPQPAQERAFLQSVVYAALFEYPLTVTQLREGLIGEEADELTLLRWYESSTYLQATIDFENGFFFPRGRRELLDTRAQRESTSRTLLRELSAPLAAITRMPFVRMVALSGSLAHLNADPQADLDLFVVTSARRVWTVTVATLALARLFGWRKRLCLNYVVSEHALWVAPADLFSANQIVHLQPVVGGDAYFRFLDANRFVERFYPNFRARANTSIGISGTSGRPWAASTTALEMLLNWSVAPLIEPICRLVYRTHLRNRAHTWKSRDQVRLEPECLKLHTSSHRYEVMQRFEQALEEAVELAERDAATREESSQLRASQLSRRARRRRARPGGDRHLPPRPARRQS
jgi:hypothetical protein